LFDRLSCHPRIHGEARALGGTASVFAVTGCAEASEQLLWKRRLSGQEKKESQ